VALDSTTGAELLDAGVAVEARPRMAAATATTTAITTTRATSTTARRRQ
jgi:hypothetical protein